MDADREEEQKQRLADFFETNTIDSRRSTAIANLSKLQNGDGSWSWWPQMKGSTLMTTFVSEMLVRLNTMTSKQPDTEQMLDKAIDFLGNDIVKLVDEMKKAERKGVKPTFPSRQALEWLYICALDGRTLPKNVTEANSYLKNHQGKYAEPYSHFAPWVHRIDFSYKHDFSLNVCGAKHTLQLLFDMKNVLNFFNSKWGVMKYINPEIGTGRDARILKYEGVDAEGYATFSTPKVIDGNTKTFVSTPGIGQCWSASIGIKYIFN
jgi:hypothetical protein